MALQHSLIGIALCGLSITASASVIGPSTTNNGNSVNLGSLEWLELTETAGVSRTQIESGYGNWLNNGWRYASRTETESLLDSLFGGSREYWHTSNYDGARWFMDNFGHNSHYGTTGYSNWNFHFGSEGECTSNSSYSCYGHVAILEHSNSYQTSQGWFADHYGLSTGTDSYNSNGIVHDAHSTYFSNLLVKNAVDVPEPATMALFALGLTGLMFSRRKAKI